MNNLEEQLKKLKQISLSKEERSLLDRHIYNLVDNKIQKTKFKSPYVNHIFKITSFAFASFFILLVSGSSVLSYQSKGALPGDRLYSFKINVREEVQGAFITSPKEKIIWQQNRVAKRIDEVKTLAKEGSLTVEKTTVVGKALDTHMAKIDKEIKALKTENLDAFNETKEALSPIIEKHQSELLEVAKVSDIDLNKDSKTKIDTLNVVGNIKTEEIKIGTESKNIINTENTTQKEETKKAVESMITKVQKEVESIKNIGEVPEILNKEIKTDSTINTTIKETELKNTNVEKAIITQ